MDRSFIFEALSLNKSGVFDKESLKNFIRLCRMDEFNNMTFFGHIQGIWTNTIYIN